MTVTSSYFNNHDTVTTKDEDRVETDIYARWRRVPIAKVLESTRNEVAECDRKRGHVLKIDRDGNRIACTVCSAEWKNEGY